MRTVADLRRAMIEETEGLAPSVTFADVRWRARRRRIRWVVTAAVAALAPLLAGLLVTGLQPAGPPLPRPTVWPEPTVRPEPTVSVFVHPSFPPLGHVITTGVRVGEHEELVFWFSDGPSMSAGLRNAATGQVRDLESGGSGEGGFELVAQIDDRVGGIVDYGLFHGDAARITVTADGRQAEAELAPWSIDRSYIVFWARRTGTRLPPSDAPLPPTDAPVPPSGAPEPTGGVAQPQFTAYDRAGDVTATSQGRSRRSDGGVNAEDRPQVGKLIRTGVVTASGRELVLWFVGDDKNALLKAGERDPRSGRVIDVMTLEGVARPPFAIGFYGGYHQLDGPGGTKILLGTYVGPAARVVMAHPAAGVTTGSAHWSAHPELVLCWAAKVPAATVYEISAVAFDANGRVLAATDFRN
ncbi:MAG TPA: hypothetical protein VFR67_13745 [Pilimelia sp.]|nr:hypothetical protein [Pilimelia sp.]